MTAFLSEDSAGAAFDRADKALYRAKESGRNRCVTG
jgi:PleD family two-component response regulator